MFWHAETKGRYTHFYMAEWSLIYIIQFSECIIQSVREGLKSIQFPACVQNKKLGVLCSLKFPSTLLAFYRSVPSLTTPKQRGLEIQFFLYFSYISLLLVQHTLLGSEEDDSTHTNIPGNSVRVYCKLEKLNIEDN